MAGRLFSFFCPSLLRALSSATTTIVVQYLPRVSRPMRERTADGVVPSHSFLCLSDFSFSRKGDSFDRIWIS